MSINKTTKINRLVSEWPSGMVYTQKYLTKLGYSAQLVHRYIKSGWLAPIGTGAYRMQNDTVSWQGGLVAIQDQLEKNIQVGGKTALALRGISHYGKTRESSVFLFASQGEHLPKWFGNHDWQSKIILTRTSFLSALNQNTFISVDAGGFNIRSSAKERAILEVLYHVPGKQGFDEAFKLMEMLPSLRPDLLNELLKSCQSVKVNRLFCFMAEEINHGWFSSIKLDNVNLGTGKREVVKGGILNKKYNITVPREYAQ